MSAIFRCDERGCGAEATHPHGTPGGYWPRLQEGWQTVSSLVWDEPTKHYCPEHHRARV